MTCRRILTPLQQTTIEQIVAQGKFDQFLHLSQYFSSISTIVCSFIEISHMFFLNVSISVCYRRVAFGKGWFINIR